MKLEKQIESLKKLHTDYTKEVELLTAKEKRVHAALKDATERMLQTFEAIQALEGKPTLLQNLADELGKRAGETKTIVDNQANTLTFDTGGPPNVQSTPEGLPPAEPGFKWAKNALGEDVLVPINLPKAVTSDSFDPRNLLDIYI